MKLQQKNGILTKVAKKVKEGPNETICFLSMNTFKDCQIIKFSTDNQGD